MTSALRQLGKYTSNRLHKDSNLPLHTGGTQGTIIAPNSFVKSIGYDTYYVNYWNCGNGIIQYEYYKVTNWHKVGETTLGIVLIGGAAFLIFTTGGAAAPLLMPML